MEYAYAVTTASKAAVNFSTIDAMLSASLPVQLTLLTLIVMSVVSWAIIFTKRTALETVTSANKPFLDAFWKASSLDDVYNSLDKYPNSSFARVFRSGYLELRKIADSGLAGSGEKGGPLLSGLDNLERALRKAIDNEVARMETRISILATTGSTGPFIGLFGTVWGIMGAFHKIGATNMASLAVVAPGISEALIATAVGLAAAIPATVAYNHFITRIKREETDLNSFSSDFLNISKRNFFKDS
jgi:biopolymer transport protein TolQ